MPEYVRVIGVGDLPPGKGHVTEVNGREIAIFNVDGRSSRSTTLALTGAVHSVRESSKVTW